MSQGACSTRCRFRSNGILSILVLLICSHRACQSFQPSPPLLLTSRSSTRSSESSNEQYSTHTHFYTDPSSANIHDQTPPPPSFQQRMREQLKRHQSKQRPKKTHGGASPLVPDVRDLNDYKEALDRAGEDDKMLAVLWYSPWCKACRAVMPGIRTLAKRHPGVRFIQVPVLEENASLHQGLDVPSVPYLHLYTPEHPRLVEERKMTRKRLSGFQKLLCDYERGQCSLERAGDNDDESDRGAWSASDPYAIPNSRSSGTGTTGTPAP